MLKKILTFMGTAVLLLSLTACSNSYTALELLELSNEAMEEVDSGIFDLDMEIRMGTGFGSVTVPLEARLVIDMLNSNDANVSMEAEMSLMGMSSNMSMYYRDGHLYVDEDGFRERLPMSFNMAMSEILGPFGIDTDLNENWIEEYSIEPTDDGHRLEFTLNENATRIMNLDLVEGIADPGSRINHEEMTLVIYVDEDYYQTSIELEMEATATMERQEVEVSISLTLDVVETGNVTVHFPAWLDEPLGSGVPVGDHELLGTWENGSGRIFLFGIGDPDSVEFRADGTVVITGGRNAGTTTWEPGQAGSVTIGHANLTYRISGDRLTLTDSARDDWTFDRAGSGSTSSSNNDRNNNDEDWEAFIEEFEDFVEDYLAVIDRLIDNPLDLAALDQLEEMTTEVEDYWMERAFDIQDNLSGSDLIAFERAMDDIVDRVLDAFAEVEL